VVEPVTVGVIAAALVAKALDRAEDDAVDAGEGALRRLIAFLRHRFSHDVEAATSTALARVEDAPDNLSQVQELAAAIDRVAELDPAFRSALEGLIAEGRRSGVDVGTIVQTAKGHQNVQIAGVADSEVHMSFGQPPPPTSGGATA